MSDSKQIQLSAYSRGIVDHFFCFTCDQHVWDCGHLIEERLSAPRVTALTPSQLQSFAYKALSIGCFKPATSLCSLDVPPPEPGSSAIETRPPSLGT